jgi:ATP-binding cassette subfamily B protein
VTHRLGSVKLANRVIVLDEGKIVDIGTHDELIKRPGKYIEMWDEQAKWYERD